MAAKRIIVITADDPNNVLSWSGTRYSIYRALVENAGSIEITYVRGALQLFSFAGRALNRLLRQLGVGMDCRFSTAYAVLVGAYLTARLTFSGPGTLLFIAGSDELAYLKTRRRVIYISDGTFRVIAASYPKFRAFPKWLQAQGDRNESRSLSRADFVIYPSKWAFESATSDYGVPSDRISVLPFGPNIPAHLIQYSPKSIDGGALVLLFVAAEWERKNGDMVLEICQLLIESGVDVRLKIIGQTPPHARRLHFVHALGYLRKSIAPELSELCEAFRQSHFLVLPTLADATPIVLSEAQAFGLPPIAYDVGGVGGAISHGRTGLLLPPEAGASHFVEEILKCVGDPDRYARLSLSCREHYEKSANWANWARLILQLASR